MIIPSILLLGQLGVAARTAPVVLAFPERGMDDSAAYQGYRTRFYRDAAGNTLQIYLDGRSGRVVHLLADAENESIGFTVRTPDGTPANVDWGSRRAVAGPALQRRRGSRTFEYEVVAHAPVVYIGAFVLGSMRIERDFQYSRGHVAAFGPGYVVREFDRLLAALGQLAEPERARQLALLNAGTIEVLRRRLIPKIVAAPTGSFLVIQPSLDGRDTLTLGLRLDQSGATVEQVGDSLRLRVAGGSQIRIMVQLTTTGRALSPLSRAEIFTPQFLAFLERAKRDTVGNPAAALRARWLERETRGVELLVSREKLMAGLPAYATYFGRDMLVSALMMRPIWRAEMSQFAIASVLRKLGPAGDVSHEEALGGQADREAASQYAALIEQAMRAEAQPIERDSMLAIARDVLRQHRRTRENYFMIDDEFQFPIVVARWITDPRISAARKRAFLLDSKDLGETRLTRLMRELALVARRTAPYSADPRVTNLVSFRAKEDGRGWYSSSWRDSNEGYGGGRFAMDVNAIWVPHALEAMSQIFKALRDLGLPSQASPEQAIAVWRQAWQHFVVRLSPADAQTRIAARLAALPADERAYWTGVLNATRADQDSVVFLALSLDGDGRPIAVANTDPATRLFLGESERSVPFDSSAVAALRRDVAIFTRPYPAGLFIDRVGPVVANDAYASADLWPQFERDRYHGPRVVWGREVNLFLLGVLNRLGETRDSSLAAELRAAFTKVHGAAQASGFHSELWSYEVTPNAVNPVRYGTGSDVQLWSTTNLAVEFEMRATRTPRTVRRPD